MQFVLIPFTICFLLYIRQENLYRFRTATALKITLTMTLAVCLIVALARDFSPVLLAAAVGMLLCSGGDFYLQYIRRDVRKFTRGIILFGLGQVCNITALFLLAPYHWSGLAVLAALLALAVALKGIGRWDTSAKPGGLLLGLGGLLFFLSDMVLGIWNYRKNHILLADLNWLLYFAGQFLLCAGYIAAA